MGQLDNTIVVFTTDNGAETITYPDGGTTHSREGSSALGKAACALAFVRWAGHIQPGRSKYGMFAALDWVPTLVEIAGGPKGDELKTQIEAEVSGYRENDNRRGGPARLPQRQPLRNRGAITSSTIRQKPVGGRYENWKLYFAMVSDHSAGFITGTVPIAGHQTKT